MTSLGFIANSIGSAWIRNAVLMVSILIAYMLFGMLAAFHWAYGSIGVDNADRMITANKIGFSQTLPISHFRRMQQIEEVGAASVAAWFGGYYREARNSLHAIAVDPDSYLNVYGDDIRMEDAVRQRFLSDRTAILVGRSMADRFGWRSGDQISIINERIARSDGKNSWSFRIAGVFEGATEQIDTSFLYIHYDRFNGARAAQRDTIGWIVSLPAEGVDPIDMGRAIDRFFSTAAERTTTDTERSFSQAFVAQFGDLALVTILVLGSALVSLVMIVASTTALAIRRRMTDIGILKGLGFSHKHILGLLVGESVLIVVVAGVIGLALATLMISGSADSFASIAPGIAVTPLIFLCGLFSMVALGIVASAWPAWRSVRTDTVAMLRRN
ncbi:MAG: FtsX-like permease family protein [Pseudomonadota bacterium]